jgi:hypothetical protein
MQQPIMEPICDQFLETVSATDQESPFIGIDRQPNCIRRAGQSGRSYIAKAAHTRWCAYRVELQQQLRDDLRGSKIVFHRVQVSRRVEPLKQHRAGDRITLQQSYRATSGPRHQRIRFTAGLVVNRLQLEHCFRAIDADNRDDQRNSTRGNRAVDPQLPSIQIGSGHCRQPSDPPSTSRTGVFVVQLSQFGRHDDLTLAQHPS